MEVTTRSGDGVQVVRSPAGTGKTFALGTAVEAWQRSGIPVLGCALSARAACELRDQAGLETTTIASLRRALDGGIELAHGSVLIVDEAGMVGTRDLAALAGAAERADAKLLLVGDDRQLPEIQAGGTFGALAERRGAIELREVRRQHERWDRSALGSLREGDVDAFARAYESRGRLFAAPTQDAARQAMVDDWYAAQAAGRRALMLAHRRADVADLNARARKRMRAEGRIGPDVVQVGPHAFAVGDRVVTTRNDRRLGLVNGQTGVLADVRGGALELRLDDGREIAVPERYARDGHLDHGYALTVHRAQGATVDRAFVLGSDELYREWGYTALSRHRDAARFYVTVASPFINQAPAPLEPGEGVAFRVARMLETSRAQHLASGDAPDMSRRELAERRRSAADARLAGLERQRAQTPWHRRGRRAELDRLIAACEKERARWQAAEELPATPAPRLRPARDPLARVDHELSRERGRDLGRGL